jgi:hypothetical protein
MQTATNSRPVKLGLPPPAPLIGYLANELGYLYAYLGDITFNKLTRDYLRSYPELPIDPAAVKKNLLKYIGAQPLVQRNPEILELADLELALNFALNAPDEKLLDVQAFEKLASPKREQIIFNVVSSAQILLFKQNTTSIWSALKCEERPPKPHLLDEPQNLLVWRQGDAPRFRLLGRDEAFLFNLISQNTNLRSALLQMNSETTDAEEILNYVRGWAEAELIRLPLDGLLK